MIEGLKVTISGQELRSLCYNRAEICKTKAETAEKQALAIEEDAIGAAKFTGGDPIRGLRDKAGHYRSEAQELAFYGDHIDLTETYLLDSRDLQRLGIVSQGW